MPLYNYRCKECEKEFETMLSLREKEENNPVFCKTCGSENVSALISKTAFILKGKGWYKDGYS